MLSEDETSIGHHVRASRQTIEIESVDDEADLIALTGEFAGRRFSITDRVVVGRDTAADVRISGSEVSRKHAAIERTEAGEFILEDLRSRNGTLVNGVPVEVRVLRFGDRVQIGARTLFVFSPHSTPEEQLVKWQRIDVLGQMAASAVHDFANHMTAVLGKIAYARHLVLRGLADQEKLCRCFAEIDDAAEQGFRLTQRVLGLARSADPPSTPIGLTSLLDDAVRLVRGNLSDDIQIDVRTETGLSVRGDRTELLQVLINLALNSRDALRDGGTILLSGESADFSDEERGSLGLDKERMYVCIRVADNGVGMDHRTKHRIFEPLYTTKTPGTGTGLGLSTVARIVSDHDGAIDVRSAPEEGTTFYIYLPRMSA